MAHETLHPYRPQLQAITTELEGVEAKIDQLITAARLEGVDLTQLHYIGVTAAKIELENLLEQMGED